MKRTLLALLTAAAAHAANYVGNQTFTAPFTLSESANIIGSVTLATPGTYHAQRWNIAGDLIFAQPGTYKFTSATSIDMAGNVVGPASGTVTVTVTYGTSLNFVGNVASSVTVIDGTQNPPPPAPAGEVPLVNLSTRMVLSAGQLLTPGFTVGGTVPRRVLIRAVGPGMTALGVPGVLPTPTLAVFRGQTQIAATSTWAAELAPVFSAVGAFPLAAGDCALLLTLAPGGYTAQIGGGAGDVLAEVYFVD